MDDATPGMLTDRAVLRVSGDDSRGFLQGLVTNDTGALAPDRPLWAGLLSPQGKALFDFLLWAEGDDVLIDCEAAQADALARRLSIYRLRRALTIGRAELAVHWHPDPAAADGVSDPRLPALGRRRLAPPTAAATGWTARRLSLGVTEGVAELGSGETLWLEANARELNGVDFAKGCYIGQENTARMHYRAKIGRRLMVCPLGEPGAPGRVRARYPDLGVQIELRRTSKPGDALMPAWLHAALTADRETDPD